MYIVVLGYGLMGCLIAELLNREKEVTKLVIAGRREAMAEKLTAKLGKKAIPRYVDTGTSDDVARLVEGADVVVDCVRAGWQYSASNARAAIKAGVPLVNLCDDVDGASDTLALNEEARKAGVLIIPCVGMSPGLSDLYAKYASNKLDKTDEIHHAWVISSATGYIGSRHMDHCLGGGKILTYRDGKLTEVAPFTDKETVEFLVGKGEVYNVGHPEPVTIPQYIRGVRTVTEKAGFVPVNMNIAYQGMYEFGLLSRGRVLQINGVEITPGEFIDMYRNAIPLEQRKKFWPVPTVEEVPGMRMRLEVKGMRGGSPVRYIYQVAAEDYTMHTAWPAVLTALMLARGEIKVKGVIGPAGCLDPVPFLAEISERGLGWFEITEERRKL